MQITVINDMNYKSYTNRTYLSNIMAIAFVNKKAFQLYANKFEYQMGTPADRQTQVKILPSCKPCIRVVTDLILPFLKRIVRVTARTKVARQIRTRMTLKTIQNTLDLLSGASASCKIKESL